MTQSSHGRSSACGLHRRAVAVLAGVLCCFAAVPAFAAAAPGIRVDLGIPQEMTKGETGLAGTLRITATGDTPAFPLAGGGRIAICNAPGDPGCSTIGSPWDGGIQLTLSCAQNTTPTIGVPLCQAPDPGVFALSATGLGSGPACNGAIFDITPIDATTGRVRLSPRPGGSQVRLGASGSFCQINFTFDVKRMPVDANSSEGIQTRALATAGGVYNSGDDKDPKTSPLRFVTVSKPTVKDACVPPQTGTPPNCTTPPAECVPPATGTPPNCTTPPSTCVPPATGTPPNCTTTGSTCVPPQVGTPPNCTTPPSACPPGTTGTPPSCTPIIEETCVPPLTGTYPDCIGTIRRLATAKLASDPRCAGARRPIPGTASEAFPVSVRVTGPAANVAKVQFMRNGRVVRTLRKATSANTYRMTVNPKALAPKGRAFVYSGGKAVRVRTSRLYTLSARVTLKGTGSFAQTRTVRVKTLRTGTRSLTATGVARTLSFRAVQDCALPSPGTG